MLCINITCRTCVCINSATTLSEISNAKFPGVRHPVTESMPKGTGKGTGEGGIERHSRVDRGGVVRDDV